MARNHLEIVKRALEDGEDVLISGSVILPSRHGKILN